MSLVPFVVNAAFALELYLKTVIVVDQGETKGSLVVKLKNLADKGKLVSTLTDWSKETRLIGNDAVHDLRVDVSMEDTRQLIVRELTTYLYVLPGELKKRSPKRKTSAWDDCFAF